MAGCGRAWRVTAVLVLASGLLSSAAVRAAGAVAVPLAAARPAGPQRPLTAMTDRQASALADSTGQPVEVISDRTDWSQTYAEPGGGFEATESLQPQQVQEPDGSWVPVDTTLSAQPDGSVAPGAITTGLSLSGGGSGPLYTLSQDGESLSVTWPYGSLPAPSLSGATATYANVLPGVNLLVTALPTGVSGVIEVTSASAAANPDLATITFPMTTTGLSVSTGASGVAAATDSSGSPVFTASPPQMWDSAGQQTQGMGAPQASVSLAQAAAGAVPGDHSAVMGMAVAPASFSLTPAPAVLSGPSATGGAAGRCQRL
jgi:hypothetical protein